VIHIRVDDERENSKRRFACGIGPDLPEGDVYYFAAESLSRLADCPGCNPAGPWPFATAVDQLSGRPGHPGDEEFRRITRTWVYD
jgi:hypothetical protein